MRTLTSVMSGAGSGLTASCFGATAAAAMFGALVIGAVIFLALDHDKPGYT